MKKLSLIILLVTALPASATMPRAELSKACTWSVGIVQAKLEVTQKIVISELPNEAASYLMLNDVNNNVLSAYKQMLYACEKNLTYSDKMELEEIIEQHEIVQDEITDVHCKSTPVS